MPSRAHSSPGGCRDERSLSAAGSADSSGETGRSELMVSEIQAIIGFIAARNVSDAKTAASARATTTTRSMLDDRQWQSGCTLEAATHDGSEKPADVGDTPPSTWDFVDDHVHIEHCSRVCLKSSPPSTLSTKYIHLKCMCGRDPLSSRQTLRALASSHPNNGPNCWQ